MKSELRIGNLIFIMSRAGSVHLPIEIPHKILTIGFSDVQMIKADLNPAQEEQWLKIPIRDLAGIKLAGEWLLRLGGQQIGEVDFSETGYSFLINGIMIVVSDDKILIQSKYSKTGTVVLPRENYNQVHLFQNLVYSLSSEELTLQKEELKTS